MKKFSSKNELVTAYAKEWAIITIQNNAQGGHLNEEWNVFEYAAYEWYQAKKYAAKKVIRTASWDNPPHAHVIFTEKKEVWGYTK